MEKLKQSKNLFKKLIKDEKSVFSAADRIDNYFKIKLESHFIGKDKIFYKFYLELDNKNIFYE